MSTDIKTYKLNAALARWGNPAPPPADGEVAELVDGPAVPAPTVMEITELSEEVEAAGLGQVDFACAALTQPGAKESAILARVEFAEREFNFPSDVVLRQYCDDWFYSDPERSEVDPVDLCRGAIKLFAQTPTPIPVTERLPGPEDCDAEGRCWWFAPETEVDFGGWTFGTTEICANSQWVDWENTHWLPAHALPLPEVGD